MIKRRTRIPLRLPDGMKLMISNRAKEDAKITGKKPNMSRVVRMAIDNWLGL